MSGSHSNNDGDNATGRNGNFSDNNDNSADNNGNVRPSTASAIDLQTRLLELSLVKKKYGEVKSAPYVELKNGYKMPVLAVGTSLIEKVETGAVIKAAIDVGYRHIDAAMIYGNENEIGVAITEKIESGDIQREELFVTSKLWGTFHRRDLVMYACNESLAKLKCKYLDLYLIHNPISLQQGSDMLPIVDGVVALSETIDYLEAWLGMEDLVRAGLVRSIGVSNFNSEQLEKILEIASVPLVVNQVECNPYLAQIQLSNFCKTKGIILGCYGSLGSMGTPDSYKTVAKKNVLQDSIVQTLAKKYKKTTSQILIRYQIDRGHYAVVKTTSAARLVENIQSATFQLSSEDMEMLNELDCDQRQFTFIGLGENHKNYPFNIPF